MVKNLRKPAIFFDRDGVLNEDDGYVYKPPDFKWIPGATEVIRRLKEKGYLVIVITNQSGVARGFYTEDDVIHLHTWMNKDLYGRHQQQIDAFYYCPHHPKIGNEVYQKECECRKPRPGLVRKALTDFTIDLDSSCLIGDKITDLETAEAIGIKSYKFTTENLLEFMVSKRIL
ncbi:HAD family hydrolase [Bacillus luteolus]|uniref:D,D-heptose 1,7-bisphosphate phosphatase n=2 Tax=Litchfieldia luteola TaxID=682179 RepID=A0ABR9QFE9_9BACI|nr:HAD family hydrolase [Cytobacillus luteolus]